MGPWRQNIIKWRSAVLCESIWGSLTLKKLRTTVLWCAGRIWCVTIATVLKPLYCILPSVLAQACLGGGWLSCHTIPSRICNVCVDNMYPSLFLEAPQVGLRVAFSYLKKKTLSTFT